MMKKLFNTTFFCNADNEHYYDCECSKCLSYSSKKGYNMNYFEKTLVTIIVILFIIVLAIHFSVPEHTRPMTVNERQTWFRENGYLDVNEPKNFDGKCGELLHNAEKDAMFWNYEKK